MIPLFASPLLKLVAGKTIEKIATELIEHQPGTNEDNAFKTLETIEKYIVPFWKQKKFYLMILAAVILVLNQIFGWNIDVNTLVCGM